MTSKIGRFFKALEVPGDHDLYVRARRLMSDSELDLQLTALTARDLTAADERRHPAAAAEPAHLDENDVSLVLVVDQCVSNSARALRRLPG